MANTLTQLADELLASLSDRVIRHKIALNELTVDIHARDVTEVGLALRDKHEFNQLVDACGADYAHYGKDEWQTRSATMTGFSRGITAQTHGRGAVVRNVSGNEQYPDRFVVVYHLLSLARNIRLRLKAWCEVDELPIIDSVVDIWPSANWFEREAFDLFGIVFKGHPDLRRILTDYGFVGHPFRKDFPLTGNVEMRYDADKGRVIYQPVSIEPRVLVPRVIRKDAAG